MPPKRQRSPSTQLRSRRVWFSQALHALVGSRLVQGITVAGLLGFFNLLFLLYPGCRPLPPPENPGASFQMIRVDAYNIDEEDAAPEVGINTQGLTAAQLHTNGL